MSWISRLEKEMAGYEGVELDIAWMVWHEYRDHFPWSKAEYTELIRPYFGNGDSTSEIVNKLWEAGLVEPMEKRL